MKEKKANVLILDDENEKLSLLAKLLNESGYTVHTTTSSSEAVNILKTECEKETPVEVLILDIILEKERGENTLKTGLEHYPHLQVITSNGHLSCRELAETIPLGAVHYFKEPPGTGEIIKSIDLAYEYYYKNTYCFPNFFGTPI